MNYLQWIKTGTYLPKPLRDFHAQKRLFKRIQVNVENKRKAQMEEHGYFPYLEGLNWVMAHVYVIDFFLWFMALHGYTLQRSRRSYDFGNLSETMEEFDRKQLEELSGLIHEKCLEVEG